MTQCLTLECNTPNTNYGASPASLTALSGPLLDTLTHSTLKSFIELDEN